MAVMVTTNDTTIQQDILEELDWDPELDATEVGVEVDEGVVTLTGWVETFAKKLAAEHAALRVDGVRAVANDLSVRGPSTRTDTDVAKAVVNALEANLSVPHEVLEVVVKNGKVTLTGEVGWAYQRAAAAQSIRHLAGVRDVINLITVKQPEISPVEIKEGIERALVRAAELDANKIRVRAEGGRVILTGTVRSWAEKQEANAAAWRGRGVTAVTNDIQVHP